MTEKDLEIIKSFGLIQKEYCKIIEVNLDEDSVFTIHVFGEESTTFTSFEEWVNNCITDGTFYNPLEMQTVLTAANIKAGINKFGKFTHIYKRKVRGEWHNVCLQALPTEVYSEDDPVVLLFVRDIQPFIDYIKSEGIVI